MDVESLREYCIRKPMVEESFPFGEDTLVFKVGGKIFLLCSLDSNPLQFNVKCDPELAIELRERYSCVQPGYHMNKKHWNTIVVDHSVSDNDLREWIDHSYGLVYKPKKR
ncbi:MULTISPECIES: MmcQ/YjbR family DNA-binding protein [unclassified Paraflavitalea]|uniref:MmcQ/YjbR family DNA-binding protein n=1 Tax=unclassified Paraflavitalea TaxID=2798305 RepID=UPI003D33C802